LSGESEIGDIVIATLNNTVTSNTATATLADTLEALFAELDLHSAEGTDLVIDELDRWRNPKDCIAGFSTQTFNLVVVQGR
jgi:hypothetical protein